jgi:acyl-CoA synthetase (AMP-forming)/AMP-acid ligase II
MQHYQRLQEYLEQSADLYPEKIALICHEASYSYAVIETRANQLASAFKRLGVKRGDRIVICAGNTVETVISFWATLKASAIVSIISPELTSSKKEYVLKDTDARIFITQPKDTLIQKILDASPELITILINTKSPIKNKNIYTFSQIEEMGDTTRLEPLNIDIDLASIIYTSGSTGEPKGVMLTHRNILAASNSINAYLEHKFEDRFISSLPLSFDYGLYQMIMSFSVAATLILEKDLFLPIKFLKKIQEYRATIVPAVPTLLTLLYDSQRMGKYDLCTVTRVTNTGAALTLKHIDMISELFPKAKIHSMYGLTECKRCTHLPPEAINRKPLSVGKAIPNTEMWIIDMTGNRLPSGHIGQLVIRGSTVMQGYWKKPKETDEKLKPGLLPNERVLYTGDYGWIDEEDFFHFTAREDDIIKTRGQKVSPKEIEDFLMTIDSIKEVAVIGIPDLVYGEAIIVFVAPKTGELNKSMILDYCRNSLESFRQPNKILVLKSLPKNLNGKIDKVELRSAYLGNKYA